MNSLCQRGSQLQEQAADADRLFKSQLLDYFSRAKKEANQTRQIEIMCAKQRQADEIFRRHQELCAVCSAAFLGPDGSHKMAVARSANHKAG